MGAPRRFSDERILRAFVRWRGVLEDAAGEIGISPNNMRQRLKNLGLDLALAREAIRNGTFRPDQHVSRESERVVPFGVRAQRSARAIYQSTGPGPTFAGVSSAAHEFAKRSEKPERPIKVLPEHADRIRSARRRLAAEMDVDLDDTGFLAELIEQTLDSFLARRLEAVRQARDEHEQPEPQK
jgi:hypothetical protein